MTLTSLRRIEENLTDFGSAFIRERHKEITALGAAGAISQLVAWGAARSGAVHAGIAAASGHAGGGVSRSGGGSTTNFASYASQAANAIAANASENVTHLKETIQNVTPQTVTLQNVTFANTISYLNTTVPAMPTCAAPAAYDFTTIYITEAVLAAAIAIETTFIVISYIRAKNKEKNEEKTEERRRNRQKGQKDDEL